MCRIAKSIFADVEGAKLSMAQALERLVGGIMMQAPGLDVNKYVLPPCWFPSSWFYDFMIQNLDASVHRVFVSLLKRREAVALPRCNPWPPKRAALSDRPCRAMSTGRKVGGAAAAKAPAALRRAAGGLSQGWDGAWD